MAVNGVHSPAKKTLFFDIDNCLYPKSYKIQDLMGDLIDDYFQTHLSLTKEDARELHLSYYKDYGLAIEGLVRHHKIDPLEYNTKVDDALPLDDIIKPNAKLRQLLEDFDRSKVNLWLFTNAYIRHGQRVIKLLGIEDLFDGITYCDYGAERLLCKPEVAMYEKAMREAGMTDPHDCYFIGELPFVHCIQTQPAHRNTDDSALNAAAGKRFGWKCAHLVEPGWAAPTDPVADFQISDLEELRTIFPELFKSS